MAEPIIVLIAQQSYQPLLKSLLIPLLLSPLFLNSVLGVIQEGKAEKAIEDFNKCLRPILGKKSRTCYEHKIRRGCSRRYCFIERRCNPCRYRLISASSLKIEEASLTGESIPAEDSNTLEKRTEDITLGDDAIWHMLAQMQFMGVEKGL